MMFKTPLINMLFPFENGNEANGKKTKMKREMYCLVVVVIVRVFVCVTQRQRWRREKCAPSNYTLFEVISKCARWARAHTEIPLRSTVKSDTCFKRANHTNTQIIQSIPAFESKQNAMIVVVVLVIIVVLIVNVFNVFVVFVVFCHENSYCGTK